MTKLLSTLFVLSLLSLGGVAQGQTVPPKAPSATPSQAGKAASTTTPSKFERTQRLEEMRYRHLWIAYGVIWFLIFFFMFRTHKLGRETATELDDLKRRLAELEASDGAG